MTTSPGSDSKARLVHWDNLRIYLTVLVILHHTAIAYGGSGDWAVKDPHVDELSPIFLTFFTAVNQSYFMSAFFLLAGYFTPRAFERKGALLFLRDRLIRLGVPMLVYTTLIINVNQLVLDVWNRGLPFRWLFVFQPGHLWFLQALLLFALIYAVFRSWIPQRWNLRWFSFYTDRFPPNRFLVLSIALLTALTFLVRIEFPVGRWTIPGFQLAHFVHYTFCFFVGILAYRGRWLDQIDRKKAHAWGVVALLMLPIFFVVAIAGGALEGEEALTPFLGGSHWQSIAYALWESIMLISVLVFLLHLFHERFNQSTPWLAHMASSVFAVYIIHQTVLFFLNVLFLPFDIPTVVKFVIVSLIAVPACFALAMLIRKSRHVRRIVG